MYNNPIIYGGLNMFCEKCGARLSDSDVFCTTCGNKITNYPKPPEVTAGYVPDTASTPVNEVAPSNEIPNNKINADISNNFQTGNNQSANQQSANQQSANYKSGNSPASETPAGFGEGSHTVPASAYYTDPKSVPPRKPKSNKGLVTLIIICSVLLIALASVFAYIMLNKDDKKVQDTPVDSGGDVIVDEPIDSGASKPDDEVVVSKISEDEIKSIIFNNSDYTEFGIYVRNLDNDYEFEYNADQVFPASAMCQVVILDTLSNVGEKRNLDFDYESIQYFHLVENGKEAPESKYDDGEYVYIRDYIEDVAIYGDNNKSNRLVEYLGEEYGRNGFRVINDYLDDNGYYNTRINRMVYTDKYSHLIDRSVDPNVTTPREIADIFHNLITNSSYGSENYMWDIFQPISSKNEEVGIKKYVHGKYEITSANGLNSQSTNDVAIVSDGETKVLVAILNITDEDMVNVETTKTREHVEDLLIDYILETQFE